MSVCFAIPSNRPAGECQPLLDEWRALGYRVVLRRLRSDAPHPTDCQLMLRDAYRGWAASVNELCEILLKAPEVEWIVTGGDDYSPAPVNADSVARECEAHFDGTFGVMQPTGDRWGENEDWAQAYPVGRRALIERICGSPWMGRDFCLKAYGGRGPMVAAYEHMFADEELQEVAIKLGAFWQRPDLIQTHHHWSRTPDSRIRGADACPDRLKWANTTAHWEKARALFYSRKAAGFPGHEVSRA